METGFLSRDLSIVILAVGAATFVCTRLKQPLLLGFIVAGILIDPVFKMINDHSVIIELGELGILFMMFFVGMEFNLAKLRKVLTPSLCAIILQTATMCSVGMAGAKMMGMPAIVGLFLGGMLSISSTIVFIETVSARGDLNKKYAHLATGILILEDLLAILMLVFLSGVAISKAVQWDKIWHVCFMLITFVVAIYASGKVFLQPLLRKMSISGSNYTVMIFTLAMIFGLGELAAELEFSVALGAFLAGSVLAGTAIANQIEKIITPFKNLFVALFFVSVGMMITPSEIFRLIPTILAFSALVIAGQSVSCFIGATAAGVEPAVAWFAGINKARIGEFSFVIAALGMKLGVIDSSIASIAMGVAFVTIFANPFIASRASAIAETFSKITPRFLKSALEAYGNLLQIARKNLDANLLLKTIRGELAEIAVYFILFNSVILGASFASDSAYIESLPHENIAKTIIWLAAGILTLPFWVAIIRKVSIMIETFIAMTLKRKMQRYKIRLASILRYSAALGISIALLSIYLTAASMRLPIAATLSFMAATALAIGIIFYRNFTQINTRLEYAFIENFNKNLENDGEFKREKLRSNILNKYPWPIDISETPIDRGSQAAGKTISELSIRRKTGANIVAIEREGFVRYDINPNTPLFPGDLVVMIGSAEALKDAERLLTTRVPLTDEDIKQNTFKISYLVAGLNPEYIGKTLRELNLTRRFGISVIGIQRQQEKISTPGADEKILSNDILLVMGKPDDVNRLSLEIEK